MLVSLITKYKYRTIQLPEWKDGHFIIVHPDTGEELFDIIGNSTGWILHACGDNQILDNIEGILADNQLIRVRIGENLDKALLYMENSDYHYAKYARCPVGNNVSFVIGSDKDADIQLNSPAVAGKHCILSCKNRKWIVQAEENNMGVFVNGTRVTQANLAPGDVVSVMNQKFIVLPGILTLNAQNVNREALSRKLMRLQFAPVPREKIVGKIPAPTFFHREPRFTNGLFEKDINVVAPPSPVEQSTSDPFDNQKDDSLLTFGPAVASGMMALLGGGANSLYGVSMLVSSILIPSLRRRKQQKTEQLKRKEFEKQQEEEAREEEKRRQLYAQYLDQLDRDLDELNKEQTRKLLKSNPRPDQEADKLLSDITSLWNRRPEHSDFLDIRLGTGNLPVKANIHFPDESYIDPNDPMLEHLRLVREKERMLQGVPIMLQLSRFYSVGVSGTPAHTEPMIAKMVLQLSMHIGYDDLKICILGKLPDSLQKLRWLPHTWNDEGTVHMVAENKDELTRLLPALENELREHRTQRHGREMYFSTQTIVFLILDETLSGSSMITRLLFDQPYERVHVISMATHSRHLPRHTDLAIGLRPGIGRMLWQEGDQRQIMDFTPDPSATEAIGPMVDIMANTYLDLQQEMSRMPDVVPFLDMFGVQDIARLNIISRWLRSDPIHSLAAPIGISEDGNLCILDLHERGDGPHGLIAGTTGSGKSEMIMNYILSMAVNYSPLEVSFVLIDYKGGGMAKAFEPLPHTAGIITNLDGNEINRSLQSIESELKRRQRIFSECQKRVGSRNIDIYKYQQLFRDKKVTEPLSHLVIIADEFAELKTEQPDFLQQLTRAARIGRSLGVHLILATQKPAGIVDDQIWSNSNFHICLRVQTPEDSRDVLKCEDAARLTRVGSMFKQVGYGEVLVKAQSGWTGADYAPDSVNLPNCGVDVLNHMGGVLRHEDLVIGGESGISQLEAGINYISKLVKNTQMRTRKLWEPVLEKNIPLSGLRAKYAVQDDNRSLQAILGEADDPARQSRHLLRLDLSAGKNTMIFGSLGSGKIMALNAILEDLLLHHTADEMQIYMLDCADDGLAIYRDAPQVGDVIGSDESEKMQRFLMMLEEQIRIRKKRMDGAAMGVSLRDRLTQANLCNILVIIHHFLAFPPVENMDERFKKLLKEGPRYGITFLATQEGIGTLLSFAQQFPQKYVLQLDSDDDYLAILGRTEGLKPMTVKGRGMYRNEEDRLFEFQTASAERNPMEMCAELKQSWKGQCAKPIRILPEQLMSVDLEASLQCNAPWRIPIALNTRNIRPEYFDFSDRFLHLVLGKPQNVAYTFNGIAALSRKNGLQVIALDPNELMDPIPGGENVNAAALKEKVFDMLHHCQAIRTRMNNGETIEPGIPTMYLIPDIHATRNSLNADGWESLATLMAGIREVWGWRFIVGGSSGTMQKLLYSDESLDFNWFKSPTLRSDGIYLGRGFSDNGILSYEGTPDDVIEYPKGYIIRDKAITKVQFVQEPEKGDWDEWNG